MSFDKTYFDEIFNSELSRKKFFVHFYICCRDVFLDNIGKKIESVQFSYKITDKTYETLTGHKPTERSDFRSILYSLKIFGDDKKPYDFAMAISEFLHFSYTILDSENNKLDYEANLLGEKINTLSMWMNSDLTLSGILELIKYQGDVQSAS